MARTREENIALQVTNLLSDMRLDPYMIGFYLAHTPEPLVYDILEEVMEATYLTREERQDRIKKMILRIEDE